MPNKLSRIILDEISLVDNPANKDARVVLFKSQDKTFDPEPFVELCKSMYDGDPSDDFIEALADEMKRQRIQEINEAMWPLMDALRESLMTSVAELSGVERDDKVRENVEAFLSAVSMKLDGKTVMEGEDDMTLEELKAKFEGIEKALKDAGIELVEKDGNVSLKLPEAKPDEALMKALETAGVKVEKTDDDYKVEVPKETKKSDDDEFITIDGERVAKSAVPAPLLKKLEKQDADIAELRKKDEDVTLAKRAETEFPNLGGSPSEKGQLIKAVDAIEDEDARKAVTESLKAADAAVGKLFKEVGKSLAEDESSATHKLNKRVEEIASEKKLTKEQAFSEFVKTREGAELRAEADAEARSN